jgi:hypothetical protein
MFPEIIDIYYPGENQEKAKEWMDKLTINNILNINPAMGGHFALMVFYNTETAENDILVIHIFQKVDQYDHVKYLNSIILNDEVPLDDNNDVTKNREEKTEELIFDMIHYNEHFFVDADDIDYVIQYMHDSVHVMDSILHDHVSNVGSGLWFNSGDIRWQVSLLYIIFTYYTNDGKFMSDVSYKSFTYGTIKDFYTNNYDETCIYEKTALENMSIHCDTCEEMISSTEPFFHNPKCGDLCNNCYYKKINTDKSRIEYLLKKCLLPGKQVVFKKELAKTIEFMKSYPEIKPLDSEKKMDLLTRINKELMRHSFDEGNANSCSICLDFMNNGDIESGYCGHCFHSKCIENIGDNCPVCRKKVKFIKLYLN